MFVQGTNKHNTKRGENMKCDYCGRGIRSGEEREQEVEVTINGGRKISFCSGIELKKYHCCSYECRLKMFDRVINALSEEGLQRIEMKEEDSGVKKTEKELAEIRKLNQKTRKLNRQADILSLIALGLSAVSLVIQIMRCTGRL